MMIAIGRCSAVGFLLLLSGLTAARADDNPPSKPTFHGDIYPIFKQKCIRCHNARKRDGKLDMTNLESLLKGGVSGPPLVPGNSKKSLMVDMIFFNEMPPKKEQPRMTKEERKLLEAWIDAGAPEGEERDGNFSTDLEQSAS